MTDRKRKVSRDEIESVDHHGDPGSIRRKVKTKRVKKKRINEEFLKKKKALMLEAYSKINNAFRKRFNEGLRSGQGKHPNFINEIVAECRREMAAVTDLYGRKAGDVVSMGQDDVNQLGFTVNLNKDKETMYAPDRCTSLNHNITQVAAGGMHSVAVSEDGIPYTWGCADDGALARVPTEGWNDSNQTIPSEVTGFNPSKHALSSPKHYDCEDETIVAVDAGASHTLFLTINGNVYSAGMYKDMDSGKFCDIRPPDDDHVDKGAKIGRDGNALKVAEGCRDVPVHVWRMPQKARKISCGSSFNAAILADETIVTWGMGHMGELARSADMTQQQPNGDYDLGSLFYKNSDRTFKEEILREKFLNPLPPRWKIPQPRKVTSIACGGFHLLVAARTLNESTSKLYSSGLNQYGQLGHGDKMKRHELTQVESMKDVGISNLAAGEFHSLILDVLGEALYSCGRADYGQLGLFQEKQQAGELVLNPTRVPFPSKTKGVRIVDIDAGDSHSFARTATGEVYSWGFGEYGSTGQPGESDITRPKRVKVLEWQYKEPRTGKSDEVIDVEGTSCEINQVSGGGQHSLMVVTRYASDTSK